MFFEAYLINQVSYYYSGLCNYKLYERAGIRMLTKLALDYHLAAISVVSVPLVTSEVMTHTVTGNFSIICFMVKTWNKKFKKSVTPRVDNG